MGLFVNPIRDELGWTATTISIGFVAGSIAGGLVATVTGRMLDIYGARVVGTVAGIVMALAMLGIALMTEGWHFWIFFGSARGAAASGAQLGTMVSLASWYVQRRGRMVGIISTGQRGGQALLPLPLLLIITALGWRWGWVALASLVVIFLIIPTFTLVRRRPEDHGLLPDGVGVSDNLSISEQSDLAEDTWTLAEAKRTVALWALIVAQAGVVLCLNASNLHITANFIDQGISQGLAFTAVTIFATLATVSVLPWGLAMERIHTRYIGITSTILLFVSMVIASLADSFELAIAFSVTYGLGLGAWTVTSRMLFANYFGRRSFGTIRGFVAPVITGVSALGPIFAGMVRDATGSYSFAYQTFAIVFLVSCIAFVIATPPKHSE